MTAFSEDHTVFYVLFDKGHKVDMVVLRPPPRVLISFNYIVRFHINMMPFSIHYTKVFTAGPIILSGLFLRRQEIAGICLNSKGSGALLLL